MAALSIPEEIASIEASIHACFDTNAPIDPAKVKRLQELRVARAEELASQHAALLSVHKDRHAIMQAKTRELTAQLSFTPQQMKLHASVVDRIYTETDRYDVAAVQWADALLRDASDRQPWHESEAASIAAGILILASEIA